MLESRHCPSSLWHAVYCWNITTHQWADPSEPTAGRSGVRSIDVAAGGLRGNITTIQAGQGFTCLLSTAGQILCWGSDGEGGLGDGQMQYSSDKWHPPHPVLNPPTTAAGDWAALRHWGPGAATVCALDLTHTAWCWQAAANGTGAAAWAARTPAATRQRWTRIAAGGGGAVCGLQAANGSSDGEGWLYCWGDPGASWVLGLNASLSGASLVPEPQLLSALMWGQVSIGASSACGVLATNGSAFCW